jgi:drug/metabolite transporter (DMT)-like permease
LALSAFVLVLAAATIHAVWNLIVVRAPDRPATTAIVFAAILGAVALRERSGPERIIGSIVVAGGVALVVPG